MANHLPMPEMLRVYNRSRESFLSLEVARFETAAEPLKRLFDFLVAGSDTGLWLKPYSGIPAIQGAKTFDLIYLDEECRVTGKLDKYPNPQLAVLERGPASALILPPHTAFASQICTGDQLTVCGAHELENLLRDLSIAENLDSQAPELKHSESSSPVPDTFRGPQQAAPDKQSGRQAEPASRKISFGARLMRWLSIETEQLGAGQRSDRHPQPRLVAYHWSGGKSKPYPIGNVSETGFYLFTDERPYPGTLIRMTLQRTGSNKLGDSIAVYAKVIRWGTDGVGFAFVAPQVNDAKRTDHQSNEFADQESLREFLRTMLAQ